jgi:hypothetical protein
MNISALCPRAVLSKTKIYIRKKTHNNMGSIKTKKPKKWKFFFSKQSKHHYFSEVQPGLIKSKVKQDDSMK